MAVDDLTRDEARERARLLDVGRYDVALDLTDGAGGPGRGTFTSRVRVDFRCAEDGASTFLELDAAELRSAALNGQALGGDAFDGTRLRLEGLATDNVLELDAVMRYSSSGEGLHRFVDPVDDAVYLYTQFETYDAHRVYGCFDQPDLKAVLGLRVVAPASWTVVSCGARDGEPGEAAGGAREHVFVDTGRISTYITALVAGPYAELRRTHTSAGREVDLGLFARATLKEFLERDSDEMFTVTAQGFDFYHEAFATPYPFGDKYDTLFVPEFNAGAMENAACVTVREDYVFRSRVTDFAKERRAETLLHELAHMWFGDLVTMRWWDDLWLNESFATWASVLAQAEATRWTHAWTTFCTAEKTWALRADQLPTTHPVAADIPDVAAVDVNFDGITYAKGASVLKQLVAQTGRDSFLAGLRTYFDRHAWGNATFDDLLHELTAASGRDLSDFAQQWLRTSGPSTLRPVLETADDGTLRRVELQQEAPEVDRTLRTHRLAVGLYDRDDDGRVVLRRSEELDLVGASTDVDVLVGERRPDLLLVNDQDLTYGKVRLDDRSLATVKEWVVDVVDPLARALCWSAAWDMTRDAEWAARDYVETVARAVTRESDVGVLQVLVRQAQAAATFYVAPAARDGVRERLAQAYLDAARGADAGSDTQLLLVRAFASLATTDARSTSSPPCSTARRSWRGWPSTRTCAGTCCSRSARRAGAGSPRIAAEQERDGSAMGERQAALARSALPTAEAKAATWERLTTDADYPNALQEACLAGFWQVGQEELLRPYVDRYVDVVERLWAERSSETAQRLVGGLFPSLLVEDATVSAVDGLLERDLPPALRRLVLEGRDPVVPRPAGAGPRRPGRLTPRLSPRPPGRPAAPGRSPDAGAAGPGGAADELDGRAGECGSWCAHAVRAADDRMRTIQSGLVAEVVLQQAHDASAPGVVEVRAQGTQDLGAGPPGDGWSSVATSSSTRSTSASTRAGCARCTRFSTLDARSRTSSSGRR